MAEMKVLDMSGAQVGTIDLCDSVFAVEVNEAILHAAVRMYLLNQRQGTQSALTRTEVSGGGKNRGARREQAEQDRAAHVLLSGRTAALYLLRSPDPTVRQ